MFVIKITGFKDEKYSNLMCFQGHVSTVVGVGCTVRVTIVSFTAGIVISYHQFQTIL